MAKRLSRRRLLETFAGLPFMSGLARGASAAAPPQARVRLGDPAWPSEASWDQLDRDVGGRLIKVRSPLADCVGGTPDANCEQMFKELKNPYYLGDEVGLTQSLGWVGAWTSEPSVYAVAAKTTQDVVAAVNFARTNNLRLVVKGGGHSYQGTSNAANSLLIWTRHMNAIDAARRVRRRRLRGPRGAATGRVDRAGRISGDMLTTQVTTKGGPLRARRRLHDGRRRRPHSGRRLRQLLEGLWHRPARASLEAEVVTADGEVKIANACTNPDLFWALKGGGGGFGVVTRVTLRTHALPEFLGGVFATIKASSDEAYRRLIAKILEFYAQALFNPHWGEQLGFAPGRRAVDCDGAPRPRPATGRGDVASLLRLGLSVRRRISALCRRRGSSASRRAVSGTPPRSSRLLAWSSRTIVPARRPTISSGPATSKKRAGSGTPTNPPGCPSRCSRTISANDWSTRCSRRRSIGASRCISTRGSPARPRRRSPRPGIRR